MNKKLLVSSISSSVLLAGNVSNVHADLSLVLEEVVVTAQRKEETLQKAAVAVDVVGKDDMIRAGVDSSTTLNKVAPSVYVARGAGSNASYFIRGVGNDTNNGYTDPAIAFNIDGVYLGRPQSFAAAYLDLERVEVLKGPQGTLYGRNATAGAINALPVKPILGETSGYLRFGAGDYGAKEVSGAINNPIGENFAMRLAGSYLEGDGYNDDGSDAREDAAVRWQIAGSLSDSVDLRLVADYSTSNGAGNNPTFEGHYSYVPGTQAGGQNLTDYVFVPAPSNVSDAHTGLYGAQAQAYYTSLVTTPAFTFAEPMTPEPSLDNSFWGLTGELNVALGDGELVIIPAYRKSSTEEVYAGIGFKAALIEQETDQVSVETRYSVSTGNADWIFGLYYFDETVEGKNAFNQQSLLVLQDVNGSDTTSAAAFGRVTWHLTDEMRIVGGVRYTEDEKHFQVDSDIYVELCANSPPLGTGCFGGPTIPNATTSSELAEAIPAGDLPAGFPSIPFTPVPYGVTGNLLMYVPSFTDEKKESDEVTYRIALEYDVSEDSLLYASYETGYRSGGFSVAVGRETYDPEYLDAFTLGSKNRFFDGRLQLNAELFYWQYEDQQVNHSGVDLIGNAGVFTENIGESSIKGVEVDFKFLAAESTLLSGSFQYLDNEVKSFTYNTPNTGGLPPLTQCPFTAGTETVSTGVVDVWVIDCSGREGLRSPEFSANLGIQQTVNMGDLELVANLDTRYRGERELGIDYIPDQRADDNLTVDLSLTLASQDHFWYVSAYVNNATDEEIKSNTTYFHTVNDVVSSMYLPPRTFGVRLGYEF